MKNYTLSYLLLLLNLLTTSCFGQDKKLTENIQRPAPSNLQALADSGIDPYFVVSKDVVSKKGPFHITREVLQDRNGIFWFATWQGIISYNGLWFTNHTLKNNLIRFHVFSLFEDSKGNIWFGTARGGLYRYDGREFRLFTTKDGLGSNSVCSMTEDPEGNVWMATENGVSRYNTGQANTEKPFTNFNALNGFRDGQVNAVFSDRQGKLWIGGDVLSCYQNGKFTEFTKEGGVPFKSVTALYEDHEENMWIGTFDGLTRFNKNGTFTELFPSRLTYYIIGDRDGNVLLTHSEPNFRYPDLPNQVLYKYNPVSGFIKIVEKDEPNDFQLFGKTIDKEGNIWFGTMHGPCCYNGKTFMYFGDL